MPHKLVLECEIAGQANATQGGYADAGTSSGQTIARGAEIVIVPELAGCRFNPPSARFHWLEDCHSAEFRLQAKPDIAGFQLGSVMDGRISFYVGPVLVAEISIQASIVEDPAAVDKKSEIHLTSEPYMAIFVSYSHQDTVIAEQLEEAYKVLGMEYLRDVHTLRSGELWNPAPAAVLAWLGLEVKARTRAPMEPALLARVVSVAWVVLASLALAETVVPARRWLETADPEESSLAVLPQQAGLKDRQLTGSLRPRAALALMPALSMETCTLREICRKGGGSFQIDHPLDPENKYLFHSFVESPDMMNIYNGVATLGPDGTVAVQMPDWFAALNRDFRYQLTSIGAAGPNLYMPQRCRPTVSRSLVHTRTGGLLVGHGDSPRRLRQRESYSGGAGQAGGRTRLLPAPGSLRQTASKSVVYVRHPELVSSGISNRRTGTGSTAQ